MILFKFIVSDTPGGIKMRIFFFFFNGRLNFFFFRWTMKLFYIGSKKNLEMEDIYDPVKDDESERLGDRLER